MRIIGHDHHISGFSFPDCPTCRAEQRMTIETYAAFWGGTVTWNDESNNTTA